MLRTSLCSLVLLAFVVGLVAADEAAKTAKNVKNGKESKATITKVDAKHGKITVKMEDQNGKKVTKTFELTGEVMMYDDNGKTVRLSDIDIFRSGDYVLLLERDGQLREIRKTDKKSTNSKRNR